MARYLLFWQMDANRTPVNPRERGKAWNELLGMVKQDMERGILKDWGSTPGESRGYCIVEGNETDISLMTQQYVPHVHFKTFPVMTVAQTEAMLRKMIS